MKLKKILPTTKKERVVGWGALFLDWQTRKGSITPKKLSVNTPSLSCQWTHRGDPLAGGQELKGGLWLEQ